jgi:serine/threonine protein kinase
MFSSAFKSISATNITGNYSISSAPTSTAGPWKIYDAKKKSTGKPYSVFVFDRKSLDSHGSSLGRSGAASFKKTVEEVVERLKKEASSLAKLRHPNILELVEPVEETRGGGLQFVTESVTASLSSLLQEKDEQERAGGPGGRSSRYVTEDADGTKRRRELEIDELEIQKGLLQVSKALEFLHENAGIVHGNLTPDAVLINAKACYLKLIMRIRLTYHSPIGRLVDWHLLAPLRGLTNQHLSKELTYMKSSIWTLDYQRQCNSTSTILRPTLSSITTSTLLQTCSPLVSCQSLYTTHPTGLL